MKAEPFPASAQNNAPERASGSTPRRSAHGAGAGKRAGFLTRWAQAFLPAIGFERRSIGARLALIVIALAVPLNILGILIVERVVNAANDAQRTSLLYAARSLAAALDAQLGKYIALAEFLSGSRHLLEDDLSQFEAEAKRAFNSAAGSWVVVANLDGQQILNTLWKSDQPLPRRSPFAFAEQKRALETKSTLVSDVRVGTFSGNWVTTIEVPVFKDEKPFRELAITMSPEGFLRLLNEYKMPQGWLAGIIDGQGHFIARVPNHGQHIGRLASGGWLKAKGQDGVFDSVSLEGDPIVMANSHSTRSGWAVGIAVKKEELQAAVWSAARSAIAVSTGLSLFGLLLAALIARRITRPIAELRDNAAPAFKPGPPEIKALWSALEEAARARNQADAALRQLNERFIAGEEAAGGFVYDWDAKADWCWRSEGLMKLLGRHPSEISPSSTGWFALMHPDDYKRIASSLPGGNGRYSFEYRVKHAHGHWVWVWDRGRATSAPGGSLLRLIGSAIDISERKQIEALLAESEGGAKNSLAEIEAIYDTARVGLCVLDCELRYVRINKRLAEMNGFTVAGHIGKTVRDIVPALADAAEPIAASIFETGQGVPDVELSGTTAAEPGVLRFWLDQWMPLFDGKGEITGINVVVEDITERKKHEEQVMLLMREVNHRAKNMLGVVQAIARHTAAPNPEDFVQRFSERLQALAMSQDLLIKSEWQGTDLAELVRVQLAHFKDLIGTRVILEGPALCLSPAATQTIGMALHELATNAGKYGALSGGSGTIEISWKVYDAAFGDPRFCMSWIETGGPPVPAPARRGFGSTVIDSMARMGLSAHVELDYAVPGLRWRLDCPGEQALDIEKGPALREGIHGTADTCGRR